MEPPPPIVRNRPPPNPREDTSDSDADSVSSIVNYYPTQNLSQIDTAINRNLDKIISWMILSYNINAISMLEKNLDKVYWEQLSRNVNAISILEKNLDKVYWDQLSCNINAISILEKNLDKID